MTPSPSLASEVFRQIREAADPVQHLRNLVNSNPPTFETEWLEFKPYPFMDTDRVIKEIWSKVLSAFANTQGGVLVWGIKAKKVQRVDAARGFQLVEGPHELRTRLMELHHQATDPPVLGIEILAYDDPSEPGKGFVACLVPESRHSPHRAEYAGKNYFMRFGDDTDIPAVSVLRRLFYPQINSSLMAEAEFTYTQDGSPFDPNFSFDCVVTLENKGNGTARGVCIGLDYEFDEKNVDLNTGSRRGAVTSYGHKKTLALSESLHPGFKTSIFGLSATLLRSRKKDVGHGVIHYVPRINPIKIRMRVFQDNSDPVDMEVCFDQDEFDFETRNRTKEFSLSPVETR